MNAHAKSILTQKDAEVRARQIRQVDYQMHFRLPESDPNFDGSIHAFIELHPEAARLSDQIFMDFSGTGALVKSVKLNGHNVTYKFDGAKIFIPTSLFQSSAKNDLSVEFSHPYDSSGMGFHRTRDKEDGKYYMYSNFEPYHANSAFPCFDQPDLKATYTLTVEAPASWVVIANTLEKTSQAKEGDSHWKTWAFPTSERFSTYLFALIAGPYQSWESKTDSGVPMRLFSRASMAKHVAKDVEHWFRVTNAGFKYFENAFDYPYPFHKYDQILTPDYNHGAMENVGAVTFTEKYIFRTDVTPLQVLRRAETIVHELAHMWFGNLVTMKWWDDLWLNESFATYVSNLAMSKFQDQIGTADVWQQFGSGNKEWAYREDDAVTTHPIVGTAMDTDEATANFDGITYGKGASVLKQLVYYIGEDAFLQGLQNYFKDFAFKNATRTDFIQALSSASGKDLIAWEDEWLKSSGTNQVQVVLNQEGGKISRLVLKQLPDEADKRLRTHRTALGFYYVDASGGVKLRETLSVTYWGEETEIPQAVGKEVPALIFPNEMDHDFVNVILDEASVQSLGSSLHRISDPHVRQMLWSTLWSMVRHATLPAQTFAKIAQANLREEQDLAVLSKGLDCLSGASWYISPELKEEHRLMVENFTNDLFQQAPKDSSLKIALFGRYVGSVRSLDGLAKLRAWMDQEEIAPGFKMDQERRWAVVTHLSAQGVSDSPSLIDAELARDKNDKGVVSAMIAQAAFPEEENKQVWWNRILNEDKDYEKLSLEKARGVMSAFHNSDRPELTKFAEREFFRRLPEITASFASEFNSSFAGSMYPIELSEGLDRTVSTFLDENEGLQVGVKRELLKTRQLHYRTREARALSAQAAAQ